MTISLKDLSILLALCGPVSAAANCEFKGSDLASGRFAPVVEIESAVGRIEVQLDLESAPVTACNFLKYVIRGAYDGGVFGRTVRADNQKNFTVPIAVIQAYPNPKNDPDLFGQLPLERTRETGLRHLDGTISMARAGIDDATSQFFICIGSQPELDFGGRRNPDGQGFAAFGKVIRGMDVVRSIHSAPADGETLTPPVAIIRMLIQTAEREGTDR